MCSIRGKSSQGTTKPFVSFLDIKRPCVDEILKKTELFVGDIRTYGQC